MRKIIDEVYMTVNEDLGNEWLVQFSSQVFKEKCGFFKLPKVKEKIDNFTELGAAQYMIIFDDNGQTGTFLTKLRDELFGEGKEKEYEEEIQHFRDRVLDPDDKFLNEVREITNRSHE